MEDNLDFAEIACPTCGQVVKFNLKEYPTTGIKFDVRCNKCGTFQSIKLFGTKKEN